MQIAYRLTTRPEPGLYVLHTLAVRLRDAGWIERLSELDPRLAD